jgi:hypothetical protein
MRDFQDRYDGRRVAEAIETKRKHYEFWDDEKELIQSSPFFFIATTWQDYVDCSIRSAIPALSKSSDRTSSSIRSTTAIRCNGRSATSRRIPMSGCCSSASTARAGASASMAGPPSSTTRPRSAGITARSSWCASNAKSIPTVRAMCRTCWAPGAASKRRPASRGLAMARRHRRSGSAATTSATSCQRKIRISTRFARRRRSTSDPGSDPAWPPHLNSGVPGTKASNAAQNCAR